MGAMTGGTAGVREVPLTGAGTRGTEGIFRAAGAPLISVVIPARNAEQYLADAAESALRQEVPDGLEILIIDDGSSDRTADAADALKAKYPQSIQVFHNRESLGAAQARNVGIRAARGEYIAFLDADDWWADGKLRAQLSLLERTGAVLCGTGRELVRADARPAWRKEGADDDSGKVQEAGSGGERAGGRELRRADARPARRKEGADDDSGKVQEAGSGGERAGGGGRSADGEDGGSLQREAGGGREVTGEAAGEDPRREAGDGRIIGMPATVSYRQLLRGNVIACSSVLMKADIAREFEMCRDDLHEDYILWLKVLRKYGDAVGLNAPFLKTRLTEGGKSRSKLKSARMTYGVYRYMGFGPLRSVYYFLHYAAAGVKKYYG